MAYLKLEKQPVKLKVEKKETATEETHEAQAHSGAAGFISYLFTCRNIIHMLHLNRTGPGSFAAHVALNEYYDAVVPIIDSIAETMQGYQGSVLTGYKDFPLAEYENADPATYLREVRDYVREYRYVAFPKDYSPIQNELDNLENLLNGTIYKLEQLK